MTSRIAVEYISITIIPPFVHYRDIFRFATIENHSLSVSENNMRHILMM